MQWVSEWGSRIKRLIEIEQATGQTPAALLDAPIAFGYERELVLAFNFLSDRRPVGMIANAIPLTEIQSYIQMFGEPDIPRDVFIDLLQEMDDEYLKKVNKTSIK